MPHAAARPSGRRKSKTALEVLKTDHDEARKLFKQFRRFSKSEDTGGMKQVAHVACESLRVHAQIEEEIFYPALREGADANDALDEADVEHSHIKELIAQLEGEQPGDHLFEARFTVLSEYVEHHAAEEEKTIFAKARKAECDLVALGEQLLARKEELGAGAEPVPGTPLNVRRTGASRNGQRAPR